MNLQKIEEATKLLIDAIGDTNPSLEKTPRRVALGFAEMLDGYNVNIPSLFFTEEGEGKDQVVIARSIDFVSICRHHLLPFSGHADVAYLPKDKVIGASKLARLVCAYAHRLQIQERLGENIAEAVMKYLDPRGVAVIITANHACMQYRGVKTHDGNLETSIMLGEFREDAMLRQELLSLLNHK